MSKQEITIVVIAAFILIGCLAFGLLQPYFEAQSWSRLTGGNATYWDALWVELRVDCGR